MESMTRRPALVRRAAATAALVLAAGLAACSGEEVEPVPTTPATTSETSTPSETESPEPTTAAPTPTETGTAAPTTATPGGTATELGRDAAALAQLLPLDFPIPPELTIIGDPTSTDDNANVAFTVPSGAEAFAFYQVELPAAGYELQPGTSNQYSTEVASGAIIARGNGFDVNLLVVEDDVEITLTRTP
jgi:hypothetical protein